MTFPYSAVMYLRHTKNTPDTLTVKIKTPGGEISYEMPVIKAQKYTIDEIFGRHLLFLIPFYSFTYEKNLDEYESNENKLEELKKEYADIRKRLEELSQTGRISEYVKCTLVSMSNKVIENIASRYARVRKEVTSVMGGKILEYEAKTILQRGIQEGRQAGMQEGRQVGIQEGRLESYAELVKDGILPVEEAAKRLHMKEEELKKYLDT